jgi:hypothetical protein
MFTPAFLRWAERQSSVKNEPGENGRFCSARTEGSAWVLDGIDTFQPGFDKNRAELTNYET